MKKNFDKTRAPKKRREPRPITDEERIGFALDRYSTARTTGQLKPIADVAKAHKRDAGLVSRSIAKAFKDGLVEIRRTAPIEPARKPDLEKALQERFPRLIQAIVVETSPERGPMEKARNDGVHALLGRALGRYIAGAASVFRDGDILGIGGGRAVHAVVDTLRAMTPSKARNVTIASLVGMIYIRDRSGRSNVVYDADFHVPVFGSFFAESVTLNVISRPIAYPNANLLEAARKPTFLGDRWKPPAIALIGIGGQATHGSGLLDKAYRDDSGSSDTSHIEPILADFETLVRLCRKVNSQNHPYSPIGDIANQFFFVRPPEGVVVDGKVERDLREAIGRINGRLLCARKKQLQEIQSIYLVGGTREKAYAIREVLGGGEYPNIRVLCTCSEAVPLILGA